MSSQSSYPTSIRENYSFSGKTTPRSDKGNSPLLRKKTTPTINRSSSRIILDGDDKLTSIKPKVKVDVDVSYESKNDSSYYD